jgi:hypothetical protein
MIINWMRLFSFGRRKEQEKEINFTFKRLDNWKFGIEDWEIMFVTKESISIGESIYGGGGAGGSGGSGIDNTHNDDNMSTRAGNSGGNRTSEEESYEGLSFHSSAEFSSPIQIPEPSSTSEIELGIPSLQPLEHRKSQSLPEMGSDLSNISDTNDLPQNSKHFSSKCVDSSFETYKTEVLEPHMSDEACQVSDEDFMDAVDCSTALNEEESCKTDRGDTSEESNIKDLNIQSKNIMLALLKWDTCDDGARDKAAATAAASSSSSSSPPQTPMTAAEFWRFKKAQRFLMKYILEPAGFNDTTIEERLQLQRCINRLATTNPSWISNQELVTDDIQALLVNLHIQRTQDEAHASSSSLFSASRLETIQTVFIPLLPPWLICSKLETVERIRAYYARRRIVPDRLPQQQQRRPPYPAWQSWVLSTNEVLQAVLAEKKALAGRESAAGQHAAACRLKGWQDQVARGPALFKTLLREMSRGVDQVMW